MFLYKLKQDGSIGETVNCDEEFIDVFIDKGYIKSNDDIVSFNSGNSYFASDVTDEIIAKENNFYNAQEEIAIYESKLTNTDYIAIKIAEGIATKEEYAEQLANRQIWRNKINELRALL